MKRYYCAISYGQPNHELASTALDAHAKHDGFTNKIVYGVEHNYKCENGLLVARYWADYDHS